MIHLATISRYAFAAAITGLLLVEPAIAQDADLLLDTPVAADAGAAQQQVTPAAGLTRQLIMMGALFLILYLLLIRPQQKRFKAHQELVGNLRRGDRVVTNGGIIGTVQKVLENDEISVTIAEGVDVRIIKHQVSSVLNKPEPVKSSGPANGNSKRKKSA